MLRVLRYCEVISTADVAALLPGYSKTSVGRYTLLSRVASKGLDSLLDRHPAVEMEHGTEEWELNIEQLYDA